MDWYVYIYTGGIGSRRVSVGLSYKSAVVMCRRLNEPITDEQAEHYFVECG